MCPSQTGAGCRVSGLERVLKFCLKMQSNADLNGLDIDSLVIEHIQVNQFDVPPSLQGLKLDEPLHQFRCLTELTLTENEQVVPKPEEEAAQKKMTSVKKQKLMA